MKRVIERERERGYWVMSGNIYKRCENEMVSGFLDSEG